MSKGVILVDFDNAFYGCEMNGSMIRAQISSFIDQAKDDMTDMEQLEVRLYGGWRGNAVFTQKADILHSEVEVMNSELFPFVLDKHLVHGNVSLVTSLFGVEYVWENTFQEKSGIHRLNVRKIDGPKCASESSRCPIHLISKATKNRDVMCPVEECGYIDFSQLVRMEQKMVDSMMVCDILEYTKDKEYGLVTVVSDDVDLHPALVLAGQNYLEKSLCQLKLMINNRKMHSNYKKLLGNYHIQVELWD